jgi:hypothetical protein
MRRLLIPLSFLLFAPLPMRAAAATDTASLQIAGRHLHPGDRFQVSVNVEYAIIDASRSTTPQRSDGGRALEEGMIEDRQAGKPAAGADFVVPASGEFPARAFTVRFDRPLAVVPDRLAAVMFHVAFSRTGTGPDGKPKTFRRTQDFSVPLGGDSTAGGISRCLVFEGFPDGALSLALRTSCAASR